MGLKRYEGEEAIKQLNLIVEKKTQKAVASCKEGDELDVTFKRVLDYEFDGVWAGRPIYVSRPKSPTIFFTIACLCVITYEVKEMNLPMSYLAAAAGEYFFAYNSFFSPLNPFPWSLYPLSSLLRSEEHTSELQSR